MTERTTDIHNVLARGLLTVNAAASRGIILPLRQALTAEDVEPLQGEKKTERIVPFKK